ncbi:MAG: NADH-ubiquinone oxidoreductase-F iron-sulfur binding region domain-containing protein [Candidatus Moraniibacteriota bacterium]
MNKEKNKNRDKPITGWWQENDYLSLAEYESQGGFKILREALSGKLKPEDIIAEIEESGLEGRGGSGFNTGMKWRAARAASERAKTEPYFICNADESEPGTYKDRVIIEKSPYLVLTGMILGAWAVGAKKGYIYINNCYKSTSSIFKKSLQMMEQAGWLGDKIGGNDFSFHIEIFEGAGSYICGEETALINSIEGKRGEPKHRPPYPTDKGLFGKPTVVNNVETIATIPFILDKGASVFRGKGANEDFAGTKLFIVNGAVQKPGIYEVPLGISLNELINEYAGGAKSGKKIKCVQVGGSAGAVYAPADFKKPLGYSCDPGIRIGSGAVLVIDETVDLKKLLQAWSFFFRRESCGKCVPCREGTYQLHLLADRINRDKLVAGDKERLMDLIFTMQYASFCPFGCFAVNGWESVLRLFPEEVFGA